MAFQILQQANDIRRRVKPVPDYDADSFLLSLEHSVCQDEIICNTYLFILTSSSHHHANLGESA